MNKQLMEKYADLAISKGVNVQKGQVLLINAKAEHYEFAQLLTKKAYEKGAKKVVVKFRDEEISKMHYENQSLEDLMHVPDWYVAEYDEYLEEDFCRLTVHSPMPGLMSDVDGEKMAKVSQAQSEAMKHVMAYSMANRGQWSLVALPNKHWAKVVFPNIDEEEAYQKLWEAILYAVRVNETDDAVKAWDEHNKRLAYQNEVLNKHQFDALHFKNHFGTDITVGLVENHIWAGGEEVSERGYRFNPNMPTEESFTMPDRNRVNGKVYASKPLDYQGQMIDEFYLVFKDGKVVDFDAKVGKEALAKMLDTDEGSRHIGEIALISYDSPISNLDILFYNTLFDENASCHMALGKAYPMNIDNGTKMTTEELLQHGANDSLIHVDFMFGTKDLHVDGIQKDGKKIAIFRDGNFVI